MSKSNLRFIICNCTHIQFCSLSNEKRKERKKERKRERKRERMCKLSFSKLVGKETSEQTEHFFPVVNKKKLKVFILKLFFQKPFSHWKHCKFSARKQKMTEVPNKQ